MDISDAFVTKELGEGSRFEAFEGGASGMPMEEETGLDKEAMTTGLEELPSSSSIPIPATNAMILSPIATKSIPTSKYGGPIFIDYSKLTPTPKPKPTITQQYPIFEPEPTVIGLTELPPSPPPIFIPIPLVPPTFEPISIVPPEFELVFEAPPSSSTTPISTLLSLPILFPQSLCLKFVLTIGDWLKKLPPPPLQMNKSLFLLSF